jgi:hypothetical protein
MTAGIPPVGRPLVDLLPERLGGRLVVGEELPVGFDLEEQAAWTEAPDVVVRRGGGAVVRLAARPARAGFLVAKAALDVAVRLGLILIEPCPVEHDQFVVHGGNPTRPGAVPQPGRCVMTALADVAARKGSDSREVVVPAGQVLIDPGRTRVIDVGRVRGTGTRPTAFAHRRGYQHSPSRTVPGAGNPSPRPARVTRQAGS